MATNAILNPKTSTLIPKPTGTPITLAMRALSIAKSQLGNSEVPKGSNKGPHIKKYLNSVGLDEGYAWCMGFVYWCVNEASKEMNVPNPLVKTAGVLNQWNKVNKAMKVSRPMPGDIFIMDFGKGAGHTGFVTKVVGERFETIEGNSNDEGSREGYEVCRKPNGRLISSCKGFIRLT
jgi:hypothetical protein